MRQGWSNQVDLDGDIYYSRAITKMGLELFLDILLTDQYYEPRLYVGDYRVWTGFPTPSLEEAQIAAENRAHDMLSACLAELPGLTSQKEVPDEDLDLPF
jgi:hypothetical protein